MGSNRKHKLRNKKGIPGNINNNKKSPENSQNSSSQAESSNLQKSQAESSNLQKLQAESSNLQKSQAESSNLQKSQASVKSIFIAADYKSVKNVLSTSQFKINPLFKINNANTTQVFFKLLIDKEKCIKKLKADNINYHTFTEPAQKHKIFVLKGFYHTSCDDLLNLIKESSLPSVSKVSFLSKTADYVHYLVHFKDIDVQLNVLNSSHGLIDNVVIKWENLKGSNKQPIQCYNCQRWGHASLNCGFKFRCVKCIDDHNPGECKRSTREGSPKCVNCKQDHAASYRECPAYLSFASKIIKTSGSNHIQKRPEKTNIRIKKV